MGADLRPAVHVLGRTSGFSPAEQRLLLDCLSPGRPPAADADPQVDVLTRLGARDFDWPEFDRWQAFFAERRRFPPAWEGLAAPPTTRAAPEARAAYRTRKLALLLDWLRGLTTRRAELRSQIARYARLGVRARIARLDEQLPCPICDSLDRLDVKTALTRLPPFHPGCRCLILPPVRPAPPAAPGGAPDRPGTRHVRSIRPGSAGSPPGARPRRPGGQARPTT